MLSQRPDFVKTLDKERGRTEHVEASREISFGRPYEQMPESLLWAS